MQLITQYLTHNPCYTAKKSIVVKGLVLHSVGCSQPNPDVFIKNWNKSTYNRACVHGFIGDTKAYITLPCLEQTATSRQGVAHRGWHGGKGTKGSVNDTHIGFEMCEPSCIKYTGGSNFICSDVVKARAFVEKTTRNAVELFAKLCKYHNLNPLEDGVIISHAEGAKRGIASNHGDPDHLWRGLGMGWTIDKFRQEVYKKMNEEEDEDMTVDKFKELWLEMRKELQDNDQGNWSKESIAWAIQNGLLAGGNKLPNGEPNYMLEDFLTREQFFTVLHRFAQLMGKA